MLQLWINHAVGYCARHFRIVIAAALLLAIASAIYTARHFAIDTDINNLLSAKLPWRQQEIAFHEAFPQTVDLILVDVGAPTPEAAEAAAREVQQGLANKPDVFRSVRDELDSSFFRRNGLLFLPPDQIERVTVAVNLAVGLAITAAGGILMVGALNPISLAFAVLFVGLGADFAIQYTVRYRAERHDTDDLDRALTGAAEWVGIPLTLAAGAAAAGFLSFTPTSYSGLAQLGIIAGFGMVVAYVSSLTLLPALIRAVKPPPEPKPLTLPALAPADAFLKRHRVAVVIATSLVVAAGLPSLPRLQFNFNPLALENQRSPALTALFRLGKEVPLNTAKVLVQPDAAATVAAKLATLPEVSATWNLANFIPADQDQKLPAIEAAQKALGPILRGPPGAAPSDAEDIAALKQGTQALKEAADQRDGVGADAARRLANVLDKLAQADPAQRVRTTEAFIRPLQLDLNDVGQSLMAEHVTRESLPPDLVRDWVAPDGRVRIEIWPKGDANDNATISRFARAVRAMEPDATGQAIGSTEWGSTIVAAFAEAAVLALLSIAILLWIVLRRLTDVLVTLIPLLVAGLVTLEICALAKFQLNYANIIALPVLLGIGVAFKIYYVTAWRRGQSNFLESVLTRAVFYSTLLTATAFGSLWLSNQPGISSMGKLLALSLVCTLTSATLFQPALMGEPRRPARETPGRIG
jgi:uncharacterized protein